MKAAEARRITTALGLRGDVEAAVAAAPPLTEAQRRALRAIFRRRPGESPPDEGGPDGAAQTPTSPAA